MSNPNTAFDVLINALPEDQAARLASSLSISRPIARPTTLTSLRSTTTTQTQSSSSSTTLTTSTTTISTTTSSVSQASLSSSSTTPSQAAQSDSSAASATPAPPASTPVIKSAGAIAGITAGSVAAAVLIILLALFCFTRQRRRRRRQQHLPPVHVSHHVPQGSHASLLPSIKSLMNREPAVYPEVAWLYDPVRSTSAQGERPQAARTSDDDLQLGANAPWNSRPSTAVESDRGRLTAGTMAEFPARTLANSNSVQQQQDHQVSQLQHHHQQQQRQQRQYQEFGTNVYQTSNRDGSPSHPAGFRRFSRPFVPIHTTSNQRGEDNDDVEDSISPLLPAPIPSVIRDARQASLERHLALEAQHSSSQYSSEGSSARVERPQRRSFIIDPSAVDGGSPARKLGRAF